MKSHPNSQEVLEALGDKIVNSLGAVVLEARNDLDDYRSTFPDFVADASERGLANWVHDRLWAHLTSNLEDSDTVQFVDNGPTREVLVDDTYRLRIKRHDAHGRVTSYPTASANAFFEQLSLDLQLDGGTEVRLIAGYRWIPESRVIGPAVLSYRDGVDNLVWMVELPEPTQGTPAVPITDPSVPPQPQIDLPDVDGRSGTIQQ